MSRPAIHSVALPLDIIFEPVPSGDSDDYWTARIPTSDGRPGTVIGRYTAAELTGMGVDLHRLRKPGESGAAYAARRIFESLGFASVCWEHVDRAGVFQSELAAKAGCELLADLGYPIPEGYDPDRAVTPTDTVDRTAPPPHRPGYFETKPDEPETMFAGTEPQGGAVTAVAHLVDEYGALGVGLTLLAHPDVSDDPHEFLNTLHRRLSGDWPNPAPEVPPLVEPERTWSDRNGATLRPGDRARWWAGDGTGHTHVTVIGAPDGGKFPDQVVQVINGAGTRMLAIAHTDLERLP